MYSPYCLDVNVSHVTKSGTWGTLNASCLPVVIPEERTFPLSETSIHGRKMAMPLPRDPGALLSLVYGDWKKVPADKKSFLDIPRRYPSFAAATSFLNQGA